MNPCRMCLSMFTLPSVVRGRRTGFDSAVRTRALGITIGGWVSIGGGHHYFHSS